MTETNYQDAYSTCIAFSRGFETMERALQFWCMGHSPYKDVMRSLCRLDGNSGCGYPPLWFTHQAETYAFASVLCEPENLRSWVKTERSLSPSAREMAAYWEDHPVIWCYFTILAINGNDFFAISDRLTGASLTLYSPALSCLLQDTGNKNKHFVALLAPNGKCMQSFGMIHSNNLGASDLDFFCTMLDQQAYMSSGFSKVVCGHFLDFLGIDTVTYVPSMTHEGTWLKQSFNKITIENFNQSNFSDAWDVERKGTYVAATLVKRTELLSKAIDDDAFWSDIPFSRPTLYIDARNGSGWLHTLGRSSYNGFIRIIRMLYPMVPMDKVIVPDYVISPSMVYLMAKQKRKCPWSDYTTPFEKTALLDNEAANVLEVVASHARPMGTASFFALGYSTIRDASGLTIGKGPVRISEGLKSDFRDSGLFTVEMNAKLEDAVNKWLAFLPQDGQIALNLFFLLLWYHAGCFKDVEAYASELAKQLPFLSKRYPAFHQDFRTFCLKTMVEDGLLQQGNNGDGTIRPTLSFACSVLWK